MFSVFIKKAKVCPNVDGQCHMALTHHLVFSGEQCSECKTPLVTTSLVRPAYSNFTLAGVVTACAIALPVMIMDMLNPVLNNSVRFEQATTTVIETKAVAVVKLVRDKATQQREVIRYHVVSGTAKVGEDLEHTVGEVVFAPNETSKQITIPITPDNDAFEGSETFTVVLNNVESQPKHVVVIEDERLNQDLLDKSVALARNLSVLSANIANEVAQVGYLQAHFRDNLSPDESLVIKHEQLLQNISNAGYSYQRYFDDALKLDQIVVIRSIDNHLAVLEREGNETQRLATMVMKAQLLQYYGDRIPTVDSWLKALGSINDAPITPDKPGYKRI